MIKIDILFRPILYLTPVTCLYLGGHRQGGRGEGGGRREEGRGEWGDTGRGEGGGRREEGGRERGDTTLMGTLQCTVEPLK